MIRQRSTQCFGLATLLVGASWLLTAELAVAQIAPSDPSGSRDLDLDTFKPLPRTGPGLITPTGSRPSSR